ncbi:MAG: FAD-dependent oxidoreductase [Kiritimatiellae bacterium]|jgi:sarcosine oxidase subunit alpha|nr:FAD-dependent oxidoreductase [Kiritimatiellia bacterium]MDX9794419.1 FAD-dependent oxidoreductase [Kiritimatiellia bacterium]
MTDVDILIIGGGPAGLAAAIAAHEAGCRNVLLLEREPALGGILRQCIHAGFGMHVFKEDLTGPEYAQRFVRRFHELGLSAQCDTMVLSVTPDREVTAVSPAFGLQHFRAKAIVLAMGCRERTRGALQVPGWRPAGIYPAGQAQRFVNLDGWMPGRRVVILGSGDIGLIMARRMTLEGAKVLACVELMPFSSGLTRNVVQCLDDYGIPLLLSHTVTEIHGRERLEAVTVAQVDAQRKPLPGTDQRFECDTLLLSVGLIPENELSRAAGVRVSEVTCGPLVDEALQTSVPGIFACGNVLHVHDLVDHVTIESTEAGRQAAKYAQGQGEAGIPACQMLQIRDGAGVRGLVPQTVCAGRVADVLPLMFRPAAVFKDAAAVVRLDGEEVLRKRFRILTPGEMVRLVVPKEVLERHAGAGELTVGVEV